MKRARPGPEWSRLCDVIGKLAGEATLENSDRAWLINLLSAVQSGEDVSRRFTENKKPSPEAERHLWIAFDYEQHLHDKIKPAALKVAERWNLSEVEGAETVRTIVKRQRRLGHVKEVGPQLFGPGFARVIDWHRERLLGS